MQMIPPMRQLALTLTLLLGLAAPALRAEDSPFSRAVDAMADRDWETAMQLATEAGPVARDLVIWTRLREGQGPFADYVTFLSRHPDWPGLDRLRARGEESILQDSPPADTLAYFGDRPPLTAIGALRLAEALVASDRVADADSVLTEAWLTLGLTDETQAALIAAFPDTLTPPLHAARTDAMLWRWRTEDATRMLPLLDDAQRALAEARIALIDDRPNQAAKIAAVPDGLQDDPGLAYDRFNRLADDGDYTDAVAILSERSVSAAALGDPFRWASWRATLARWAMREGRPDQAYALATSHYLTEGDLYADLEWVAGYVALTYLDDPTDAKTHFQRVEAAATGPISTSRGAYWTARAEEVLDQPELAALSYDRAAQFQTAFYGLLAAEKLGRPLDAALIGADVVPDWRQAEFLRDDLAQAMLLLLAADERTSAVLFATKLAQTLEPTEIAQLGAMFAAMDEPFLAVLIGKAAVERGIIIPAVAYPLHRMATLDLPVETELALSIARRESEFNATVGSPVGALGLMQLMPGTAEEVAGELGLPYSRAKLTADWAYNATLGTRYLANLEAMFGPSPVMIAAGYNAGPSRPRTWMAQRGDPRQGDVDVIDWIEHIPFTETRNYVMRVTETIPIYQARLSGVAGPIRFTALLNGAKPFIRPQARPDPVAVIVATTGPVTGMVDISDKAPPASDAAVTDPAADSPMRPQARPGG